MTDLVRARTEEARGGPYMTSIHPAGMLFSLHLSEAGGTCSTALFDHSGRENDHG